MQQIIQDFIAEVANPQTREKLKKYFETGDFPTEAEFAELIDSFALLSEFNTLVTTLKEEYAQLDSLTALENAIKALEKTQQPSFSNIPVIKVQQPLNNGMANWAETILFANKAAYNAGLTPGNMFWMQAVNLPNTPLVLMQTTAPTAIFNNGSGANGGIGSSILNAWANNPI